MKKDIRVIALDLDGTLFNSQKEVSQHTKDVLAECSRRGIIVMPATGRPATGFPHVLEAVPSFRYALTSNGALVYDFAEKKGIYEDTISVENALKVVEFTRKYDVMCDAYIGGYGYSEKDKLANIANYFQTQKMIDYVLSTRIPVDDMGKFIRENGVGGLVSQGIGTSMIQMPNLVKKPILWLPPIISSAILGPISSALLKMVSNPVGSGMGSAGLVGQFSAFESMTAAGVKPVMALLQIVVMHFVLPAVLTLGIAEGMRKLGFIKSGDLKLADINH